MITVNPRNLEEAKILAPYIDCYLIGLEDFSPKFLNPFSFSDFKELFNLNKKIILRLDRLVLEKELNKYLDLIDSLKEYDLLYYITEQGLLNKFIKDKKTNLVIYDPFTMLTNYEDGLTYYNLGLDSISPSLEIPYKDILNFKMPLFYLAFGRRLMFYSKRQLLSLYKEKANLDFSLDNLYIVEEKRDDKYLIFEDEGTYIYRSYFINNIPLIKENKYIKYHFIDSLSLEPNTYLEIVKRTKEYLDDKLNILDFNNIIKSLNLVIEDGFTYQDTIYIKGDIEDEKN